MAGTNTAPPPMPRRPTSTPTTSPSKRIIDIIVIGLRCTYRRNGAGQALPIFPCPAARGNIVWTGGDSEECRLFLFARNLLYLHVFSRPPCGLLAPTGAGARKREDTRKHDYVKPGQIEDKENEYLHSTHSNLPETRILQRLSAQSRNHRLRVCGLAAGAAICRSGT